jgi:hypothetical protein
VAPVVAMDATVSDMNPAHKHPNILTSMLRPCKNSVSFWLSQQNFVHLLIHFMRATYPARHIPYDLIVLIMFI